MKDTEREGQIHIRHKPQRRENHFIKDILTVLLERQKTDR